MLSRPRGPLAAYRFMVNPDLVGGVIGRGKVFRQEIVHVALGVTDDRGTAVAVGGHAEYVGRSALPVEVRRGWRRNGWRGPPRAVLEASQRLLRGRRALNYGLAGLVCDYLATTRGEDVLWGLLNAFGSSSLAAGPEAVVPGRGSA